MIQPLALLWSASAAGEISPHLWWLMLAAAVFVVVVPVAKVMGGSGGRAPGHGPPFRRDLLAH
jgi:hypothetical protein